MPIYKDVRIIEVYEADKEYKIQYKSIFTLDYMTTAEENRYFDRKSAKIKVSDLADLISAFANAEGGTIAIGISDKTKKIEGIDAFGVEKINSFIVRSYWRLIRKK